MSVLQLYIVVVDEILRDFPVWLVVTSELSDWQCSFDKFVFFFCGFLVLNIILCM